MLRVYSLSVLCMFAGLALTGCSGIGTIPDTSMPSIASAAATPLQGNVFGGHAPIVDAEVFVLQAGIGSYAADSKNIMTSGSAGTNNTYGKYVVTASDGSFNISGDYACTPGLPVYLAAMGGYTSANIGGSAYNTSPINITAATVTHSNQTGEYTYTLTADNLLFPGQVVTLALANANGGANWTKLDGSATVLSATTSEFVVESTTNQNISGSATGTATVTTTTANPAIINLAVLGNCPATGATNFGSTSTDPISYVYMNEVSTVATAYALSAFGTGPFNIGIPSSANYMELTGIQNAANNANQLYSIEGADVSTTFDGEGHIAREYTPAPTGGTTNGIVPEATLDTLGNILASCVDSPNTAVSATDPTIAGSSDSCQTLFENATSNGIPFGTAGAGTVPTDIATAAFNIAQNPAGAHADSATVMGKLFALQGSEATPFAPALATQPNDFTIGIAYPATMNPNMSSPESIAIDGSGNVFFSNQGGGDVTAGYITGLLPTGVPSFNYAAGVTPGYLTVDPNGSPGTVATTSPAAPAVPPANHIWYGPITGDSAVVELSNSGTLVNASTKEFSTVSAVTTDSNGDFYFISATPGFDAYEFTSTFASAAHSPFSGSGTCIPSADTYDHLSIDTSQQLWVSDEHGGVVCRFTATGTVASGFPVTTGDYPEAIGFDATGNAWVSMEDSNEVYKIPSTGKNGTIATYKSGDGTGDSGATFNEPFSATVDGSENVWVTNRAGNSIAELSSSGAAVSPTANYQPTIYLGATTTSYALNDPLNAAIDGSGNIWITNYDGNQVVELIGAATPVVTPLSYASGHAGLGVAP